MILLKTLFLVLATTTLMAAGPTDAITLKLGRHIKVTDTYLWTTKLSDQQQMLTRLPSGQVLDSTSSRTVDLIAEATVAYVTVDGEEREKSLKIRRFTVNYDGAAYDYLHTGAVVNCVFSDSGSVFTMNGQPVPDSVAAVLGDVVHSEGGEKTGRILDPKKPVKPGDSWKMNIGELMKTIAGGSIHVNKKYMKGTVRLVGIDATKDHGDVALVVGEARATRVRPAGLEGLRVGDVHMNMSFSVAVPVDRRYPPTETSTMLTMDIPARMATPDGQTIDLQIRSIRSQDSRFER